MSMRAALAGFPAVDRGPWVRRFGLDDDSWNVDAAMDVDDEVDGDGSGNPGRQLVARALDTFARCWGDFDPQTAARIFNLPIDLVDDVDPGPRGEPAEVSIDDLAVAIQVLTACRTSWGTQNIESVAAMLNRDAATIVEAVDSHHWMFVSGEGDDPAFLYIEHEGE